MNEGWATFWHKRILDSLPLPQDLRLEFMVRHNQVARPFPKGINPYHLGLRVWEDICRRHDGSTPEEDRSPSDRAVPAVLFEVREADRDTSFLRRHLTARLMNELHLFEHETRGEYVVVSRISDEDGWRSVKETLLKNVGMNTVPVIKVEDSDFGRNHTLYLKHDHDGRDLQLDYAEKTLAYAHALWKHDVALETSLNGDATVLLYTAEGVTRESP
jgi:stage V sporulation protein R